MNKKKIFVIIGGIILVVGVVLGIKFYNDYNEKTKNAGEVESDFVYTPDEFLTKMDQFENDEEAREFFKEKVIEIEGVVIKASGNDKGSSFDVLMETSDPSIEINFNLIGDMKDEVDQLKVGNKHTLKGFYVGKQGNDEESESEMSLIDEVSDNKLTYELNRGVIIK